MHACYFADLDWQYYTTTTMLISALRNNQKVFNEESCYGKTVCCDDVMRVCGCFTIKRAPLTPTTTGCSTQPREAHRMKSISCF